MKNLKRYFLTSESVTEGHPDKVCDCISDSILDAYLEQDRESRVAVDQGIMFGYATNESDDYMPYPISVAHKLKHIAKNIVANGLTDKCEIQMSYGIGLNKPLSLYIDCKTKVIYRDDPNAVDKLKETFSTQTIYKIE